MPADATWQGFALTILSSVGASAALTSVIVWLAKTTISERLKSAIKSEYDIKLASYTAQLKAESDNQIETHKAKLKAESDASLERLKSSLSIAANQRNVAFMQLQSRRVDVIAETYAKLKALHGKMTDYGFSRVSNGPENNVVALDVDRAQVVEEFGSYFVKNQIFLTKEVADSIEAIRYELFRVLLRIRPIDSSDGPDALTIQDQVLMTLTRDIPDALTALEKQLRGLLGDEETENSPFRHPVDA